jgi:hypothetical protein
MNDIVSADVRRSGDAVSGTPLHAPRAEEGQGGLGPVTYAIKVLSQGPGEGGRALRTVLFRRTSVGDSIEISAETDARDLLAELPDLLDAALSLQRALWPAQRTVGGLPVSFFPLLAEEARLVRRLFEGGGRGAGGAAIERRRLTREAMIVRDVAWEALRGALPPERRAEVDALVGASESEEELARSSDAIAAFVEGMLAGAEGALALSTIGLDAAYAAALRRQAAVLRAAMREAGPLGERGGAPRGRGVLRLIGMAYRALCTEAFLTVTDAGTPPRARRRGAGS